MCLDAISFTFASCRVSKLKPLNAISWQIYFQALLVLFSIYHRSVNI